MKKQKKNYKKIISKKNKIINLLLFLMILSIFTNIYLFSKKNKTITKNIYKYRLDENIVFFGDSLTYRYDLNKYFEKKIINSWINANISIDLVNRIEDDVYRYNPSKVVILIGINDLNRNHSEKELLSNTKKIIKGIKKNRRFSEIYVQSLYPVNHNKMDDIDYDFSRDFDNEDIINYNKKLKNLCKKEKVTYINMFDILKDDDNNLKEEYTVDGLHLSDEGYQAISKVLSKYI